MLNFKYNNNKLNTNTIFSSLLVSRNKSSLGKLSNLLLFNRLKKSRLVSFTKFTDFKIYHSPKVNLILKIKAKRSNLFLVSYIKKKSNLLFLTLGGLRKFSQSTEFKKTRLKNFSVLFLIMAKFLNLIPNSHISIIVSNQVKNLNSLLSIFNNVSSIFFEKSNYLDNSVKVKKKKSIKRKIRKKLKLIG